MSSVVASETSRDEVSSTELGLTPFDLSGRTIAYFSMEIALSKALPTYSGGLGVLAGDTLRSAADLSLPMLAVTLAHRCGYFVQHLDAEGQQTETDQPWLPETILPAAVVAAAGEPQTVQIELQGRALALRAWRFDVRGITGHVIPVYLLDSDVEGNDHWHRTLTNHLYGGDGFYRLAQEAVLGLGGIKLIEALGASPKVYHMNEGHAALLTLGLVQQELAGLPLAEASSDMLDRVRQSCVFTTHTPVSAGHDKFGLDQMYNALGHDRASAIERFGCIHDGLLNMTYLALRFSRYCNGVAMQHGKESAEMFPEYKIHAITNGVHAGTWMGPAMQELFDKEVPEWRKDNLYLRSVYGIDPGKVAAAQRHAKNGLLAEVARRLTASPVFEEKPVLSESVLTLGFARRVATYKRAGLLFHSPERLIAIAEKLGGLQILFGGKAHPADQSAKELIKRVYAASKQLNSSALTMVYLENYDWDLGQRMTAGVDVWVNTPRRPLEASGTSGMKAALNGVPSLSILDGWWIEGCAEGSTGWAIDDAPAELSPVRQLDEIDAAEAASLYDKLEHAIAPLWSKPDAWQQMQRHCIGMNGTFFNTDRMIDQYLQDAYFPANG